MIRIQNYIKEVIQEMKKVTWPTREELQGSTMVVVIFALVMGAFVASIDFCLSQLVRFFL